MDNPAKQNEGWTWLYNARKWHYFRDRKSLCKKYMILGRGEFELGNDNSPDNCATCKRIILKEREKLAEQQNNHL